MSSVQWDDSETNHKPIKKVQWEGEDEEEVKENWEDNIDDASSKTNGVKESKKEEKDSGKSSSDKSSPKEITPDYDSSNDSDDIEDWFDDVDFLDQDNLKILKSTIVQNIRRTENLEGQKFFVNFVNSLTKGLCLNMTVDYCQKMSACLTTLYNTKLNEKKNKRKKKKDEESSDESEDDLFDEINFFLEDKLILLKKTLLHKIRSTNHLENTIYYFEFASELVRGLCKNLSVADVKKVSTTINTLYNSKVTALKPKGKGQGKKAKLNAGKALDSIKFQKDLDQYEDFD